MGERGGEGQQGRGGARMQMDMSNSKVDYSLIKEAGAARAAGSKGGV